MQVLVPPLVGRVPGLYPDLVTADVDGERLQVVALVVEASAALEVETAAMPVAGQDPVLHHPAGQRKSHVRALVVRGVYPSVDVEERDASPFADFDGTGLPG